MGKLASGLHYGFHQLGVKRAIIGAKKGVCSIAGIEDHKSVDRAMYGTGAVIGKVFRQIIYTLYYCNPSWFA